MTLFEGWRRNGIALFRQHQETLPIWRDVVDSAIVSRMEVVVGEEDFRDNIYRFVFGR